MVSEGRLCLHLSTITRSQPGPMRWQQYSFGGAGVLEVGPVPSWTQDPVPPWEDGSLHSFIHSSIHSCIHSFIPLPPLSTTRLSFLLAVYSRGAGLWSWWLKAILHRYPGHLQQPPEGLSGGPAWLGQGVAWPLGQSMALFVPTSLSGRTVSSQEGKQRQRETVAFLRSPNCCW